MIPRVGFKTADGNTGVTSTDATGVLAILAPSSTGTSNQPTSETVDQNALADFGYGRLSSFAAYDIGVVQKPTVLVRTTAATPGAYGSITSTSSSGAGTSVVTAVGQPYDDFDVFISIVQGGTIGVSGITYTWSLDGGSTPSGVQALGTANKITIAEAGVELDFGAGTVLSGQTIEVQTSAPQPTTTDLTAALEAMRTTALPYEALLIDGVATAAMVSQVDQWLQAREGEGRFKIAFLNASRKQAGETEAAYLTRLQAIFAAATSLNVVVCADAADLEDVLHGVELPRPTSLFAAARCMKISIGTDPAYVALGAVDGAAITDARSNPKYHNEAMYPGLDDIRLATFRTFPRKPGAYFDNVPLISPAGSDFVWVQHARVMNAACEIAWDILSAQLSKGVDKNPKKGPNGEVYIADYEAQRIEQLVNSAFSPRLDQQCADRLFTLSRTDNIGSNGPATVTGTVQIEALAYLKDIEVTRTFVKTISVPANG